MSPGLTLPKDIEAGRRRAATVAPWAARRYPVGWCTTSPLICAKR